VSVHNELTRPPTKIAQRASLSIFDIFHFGAPYSGKQPFLLFPTFDVTSFSGKANFSFEQTTFPAAEGCLRLPEAVMGRKRPPVRLVSPELISILFLDKFIPRVQAFPLGDQIVFILLLGLF